MDFNATYSADTSAAVTDGDGEDIASEKEQDYRIKMLNSTCFIKL